MKQLRLGSMSYAELAEWFGIKPNTLAHTKEKRLKELESFCIFEDFPYKGVEIKEIFQSTYVKNKWLEDVKLYKELIEKQPEHLASISAMTKEVQKQTEFENLSERAIMARLSKAGEIGFGITKEEGSHGQYGSREYVWAIKLDGPIYYRYFSAEEKKLFDDLTVGLYSANPEKIQKLALLDQSLRDGEMTSKEYIEKREALGVLVFSEVLYKFKEKTGLVVARATKHQIENNFKED